MRTTRVITTRRVLRLCLPAAITGCLAVGTLQSALASPGVTLSTVSRTAWYWASSAPPVSVVPVALPVAASGIPTGDLGVGHLTGSQPDKFAAIAFDATRDLRGGSFSRFVLSLPLDSPVPGLALAPHALIDACALLGDFIASPDPQTPSFAPTYSATRCASGRFDASVASAGGYVFDLRSVVSGWLDGAPNAGIVVVPHPGASDVFSYAFSGLKAIRVRVDYRAGPKAEPGTQAPLPQFPPAAAPANNSGNLESSLTNGASPPAASREPVAEAHPPAVVPVQIAGAQTFSRIAGQRWSRPSTAYWVAAILALVQFGSLAARRRSRQAAPARSSARSDYLAEIRARARPPQVD